MLLIALGAPFLTIQFTGIDPSRAADATSRRGSSTTRSSTEFPPSETSPVYIAVGDAPEAEVRAYAARLPAPVAPPRISDGPDRPDRARARR